MQKSISKRLLFNTFWLSVLLHLLIFLGFIFSIFLTPKEEQKKPPHLYVPSYVYKGAIQPTAQTTTKTARQEQKQKPIEHKQAEKPVAKNEETLPTKQEGIQPKKRSLLASSLQILQQQQINAIRASMQNSDPIYLIGDESAEADPIIKLMGRALSANFEYPRVAGELGIKGRVLVSLTLHPEGYFSDVQIIRSSHNDDLDAAALYAVNNAPVVAGIHHYLQAPKHYVVGFIFR